MEQVKEIRILKNECPKSDCTDVLGLMSAPEVERVLGFHKSFPQYKPTPLVKLDALARRHGVKGIYVKDESYRFGLNSFKVLGGSYAIARYIAKLTGRDVSEMSYKFLTSEELKKEIGQITFFTATDGNHGRGIAWAANKLGQKAVVYMPNGSSKARLNSILAEGAEASIIEGNYDDAVRLAAANSKKIPHSVVVQDTAWPGYEEIPSWIMQGYGTMAAEADRQLDDYGVVPTHLFVQAGVGSLAGAVQGYYATHYKEVGKKVPKIIVMEPHVANCLYESALAKEYRTVGGQMHTLMAGLACGEPNTISWEIIKNYTDFFTTLPEWTSARGMRILSNPLPGDERVLSGESGAVGMGLLSVLCRDVYKEDREAMGIDEDSVVLLFSTEGYTDPEKSLDIIWSGEYGIR